MLDWSKVRGLARESPWSTRLGAGHEANHPALGPYVQHDTKRTTFLGPIMTTLQKSTTHKGHTLFSLKGFQSIPHTVSCFLSFILLLRYKELKILKFHQFTRYHTLGLTDMAGTDVDTLRTA